MQDVEAGEEEGQRSGEVVTVRKMSMSTEIFQEQRRPFHD